MSSAYVMCGATAPSLSWQGDSDRPMSQFIYSRDRHGVSSGFPTAATRSVMQPVRPVDPKSFGMEQNTVPSGQACAPLAPPSLIAHRSRHLRPSTAMASVATV